MRHELTAQFGAANADPLADHTEVHQLANGATIIVRPYVAQDFDHLRDLFNALSQQARRFRLMTACSEVPEHVLRLLADVDYYRHFALVVELAQERGRKLIGEARYVGDLDEPLSCEFAITVADQWAGHGLGWTLLDRIERLATANGFTTMRGEAIANNHSMVRLAQRRDYRVSRHPHDPGLAYFEKSLTAPAAPQFAVAA